MSVLVAVCSPAQGTFLVGGNTALKQGQRLRMRTREHHGSVEHLQAVLLPQCLCYMEAETSQAWWLVYDNQPGKDHSYSGTGVTRREHAQQQHLLPLGKNPRNQRITRFCNRCVQP